MIIRCTSHNIQFNRLSKLPFILFDVHISFSACFLNCLFTQFCHSIIIRVDIGKIDRFILSFDCSCAQELYIFLSVLLFLKFREFCNFKIKKKKLKNE